jgi:hypothetical protein
LIAPPSAVHRVITDRLAPKKDIDQLRKVGIEITQVDAGERHATAQIRKRTLYKRDK